MTTEQVHTCSYYCDRPGCVKDQRDELRDRLEGLDAEKGGRLPCPFGDACVGRDCNKCGNFTPGRLANPQAVIDRVVSDALTRTDGTGVMRVSYVNPDDTRTPPAQAAESVQVASNPGAILSKDAEAVERVREDAHAWEDCANFHKERADALQAALTKIEAQLRAAIAAMQAGEG